MLSGVNYVYQFCVGAAKGVLSPFVLQEIIMEALQRLNPAHIHAHLRTPAFHQLVQRCQQAYLQVLHIHAALIQTAVILVLDSISLSLNRCKNSK